MIPKQISGSTRIVALGVVLRQLLIPLLLVVIGSWPVWGWAGELTVTTTECKVYYQNGTPSSTCDPMPFIPYGELPKVPDRCKLYQKSSGAIKRVCDGDEPLLLYACYQRMREAMQAVAPYLSKSGESSDVDAVYYPPSMRLRQGADRMDKEDAAVAQFRTTLKECIP